MKSVVVKPSFTSFREKLASPVRPNIYPSGFDDELKMEEERYRLFKGLKRNKSRSLGPPVDKDPFRGFSGPDDPLLIPDSTRPGPSNTQPSTLTIEQTPRSTPTPMVIDLTAPGLSGEQPDNRMEVDTEPTTVAKIPFERPAGAPDPPELIRLRALVQGFPDPTARDPAT